MQGFANINVSEVPFSLALRQLLSSVNPPLTYDLENGTYHVKVQRAVAPPPPTIAPAVTIAADPGTPGIADPNAPKRFYRIPIDKYDAFYIASLLGATGIIQVGVNEVIPANGGGAGGGAGGNNGNRGGGFGGGLGTGGPNVSTVGGNNGGFGGGNGGFGGGTGSAVGAAMAAAARSAAGPAASAPSRSANNPKTKDRPPLGIIPRGGSATQHECASRDEENTPWVTIEDGSA